MRDRDDISPKEMDNLDARVQADTERALQDPYNNAKISANHLCAQFMDQVKREHPPFQAHIGGELLSLTIVQAASDQVGTPTVTAKKYNTRGAANEFFRLSYDPERHYVLTRI